MTSLLAIATSDRVANGSPSNGIALTGSFEYQPRWVIAHPALELDGLSLKRYVMCASTSGPAPALSDDDWRALLHTRTTDADQQAHDGLGFAIVHFGVDGSYLLLSRWFAGHALEHQLFSIRRTAGEWAITSLATSGIIGCVWELAILEFERAAWIRTTMADGGGATGRRRYLQTSFAGWV